MELLKPKQHQAQRKNNDYYVAFAIAASLRLAGFSHKSKSPNTPCIPKQKDCAEINVAAAVAHLRNLAACPFFRIMPHVLRKATRVRGLNMHKMHGRAMDYVFY